MDGFWPCFSPEKSTPSHPSHPSLSSARSLQLWGFDLGICHALQQKTPPGGFATAHPQRLRGVEGQKYQHGASWNVGKTRKVGKHGLDQAKYGEFWSWNYFHESMNQDQSGLYENSSMVIIFATWNRARFPAIIALSFISSSGATPGTPTSAALGRVTRAHDGLNWDTFLVVEPRL